MADFAAGLVEDTLRAAPSARKNIWTRSPVNVVPVLDDPEATNPDPSFLATRVSGGATPPTPPQTDRVGVFDERGGPGNTFFERMHVIPRKFELGNVLSTQTVPVEIHNAFRRTPQSWTSFVNNAGDGITLIGQGTLPRTILNQASISNLNLEVSTVGPPTVDTTLDFGFAVPVTLEIPISLRRVILFGVVPPELPYTEQLEFLTDIQVSKDGTEQRMALRQDPRQIFRFRFGVEEGDERTTIENLLFARQGATFGVPVWHESAALTSDIAVGTSVIPVDSTDFADFRDTGFIVIYQDRDNFDVATTTAKTSTSITVDVPTTNAYSAGTTVFPLRLAVMSQTSATQRYPVNLSFMTMEFRVIDNFPGDIQSAAAFNTYDGKVLIDNPNFVQGTTPEQWERRVFDFDPGNGRVFRSTFTPQARHTSQRTFWTSTRQGVWELRQLLHFLHGQQISFFAPIDSNDLTATSPLVSGVNTVEVENTSYSQTVESLSPRRDIRVSFNNGSAPILRRITSAVEVSSAIERLTLDSTWPSNVPLDEIERIEFVEKQRFATDTFSIEYQLGGARAARMSAPVRTVFET